MGLSLDYTQLALVPLVLYRSVCRCPGYATFFVRVQHVSSGFDKPVILCVDDSDAGLTLRKAVLEKEGYWVFVARDSDRAIFICQRHPVALIIADHMLKGETGL